MTAKEFRVKLLKDLFAGLKLTKNFNINMKIVFVKTGNLIVNWVSFLACLP